MLLGERGAETGPGRRPGHRLCLLFGVGLVGGRIGAALVRRGWSLEEIPNPWDDAEALASQLEDLRSRLSAVSRRRVDLIWSAGRAGFASDTEETRGEERSFRRVLALADSLSRSARQGLVFHLVSSAGGLFEGQRHVDRRSSPRPLRPYGELKLRLEELLLSCGAELHPRIYRLSSVFGPAAGGARRGLIPTLLHDAREGRTTRIVGDLTTLRDYLFTEDVARHVADACGAPPPEGPSVELLASGKPTSIHEILHMVKRAVGRAPALRFAGRRGNRSDITFAASALPAGWEPSDLQTSLRRLARGGLAGRAWDGA